MNERRGSLMLGHVHNSSKRMSKGWDVQGGIPQNACWRLGCGEACQTLKHDKAIHDSRSRAHERNAMKLSLACAQRQHGSESIKFCFACGG